MSPCTTSGRPSVSSAWPRWRGPDNGLLLGDGLVVILGGGFGPAVRLFLDEHRGLVDPLMMAFMFDTVLLTLEELPVGGDLQIKSDLDVHELPVLPELVGHLALELFKLLLQIPDLTLVVFDLAPMPVFHLVHGVPEGVVGAPEGLDLDLQGLLSLPVLVDLLSSISEVGLVAGGLLLGLVDLGVAPLVDL